MNRRELLRNVAVAAAGYPTYHAIAQQAGPVTKVYVAFKCHLDVGFTDTQANVMRKYFDVYFPRAIQVAERQQGSEPYLWTTGAWILYEYLEQASPAQRKAVEAAVAQHQIAWHALPFSWQTELLTPSMIEGGLSFSEELDRRFGVKTIAGKMSDVPGHTRGLIAPLAAHGVKMVDIGVNSASTAPEVPDLFVWQDTTGAQITMAYHRADYGGTIVVPGSTIAYSMQMAGDNAGPHTAEQISKIYGELREQFPKAEIVAASLSDVAAAIAPYAKSLPVVKQEIGDTWIHGAASDPPKIAEFRECMRLRERWIADKRLVLGGAEDRAMLRRFLLGAEHTAGTDTKTYIDNNHYRPKDLEEALSKGLPGYAKMEASWKEKRDDLNAGLRSLPPTLQAQAMNAVVAMVPTQPNTDGMHAVQPNERIDSTRFSIAINGTGAIVSLFDKAAKREWATPAHPLAVFTYQTLSAKEFSDFIAAYIHRTNNWASSQLGPDWALRDFGKPNIDHFGAQSSEWPAKLQGLWTSYRKPVRRIVAQMALAPAPAKANAPVPLANIAPPQLMYLDMHVPDEGPIDLVFTSTNKLANRMPEAMWLTFNPAVAAGPQGWVMSKAGQPVRPDEVVRGGNRAMHAVDSTIAWSGADGSFRLDTLDAPLIAVGARTPIGFTREQPAMNEGFHVNLYNNAWGTNYAQWCGGDWMYRFQLSV